MPSISVVIAARNESRRILPCLLSLEKLGYPLDRYEIIIVDDGSTDNTSALVEGFCQRHANWRLLRIDRHAHETIGKNNALSEGIAASKNEIICATDADCLVPPQWLSGMARHFDDDVAMVIGYSPLVHGEGIFHRLLEFDNVVSAISMMAPAMAGYPFASAGRNLAYRRAAYENAGGSLSFKKLRNDDTHLTERFRLLKTGRIDCCVRPETFVRAQLPLTTSELFNQQVRKNSGHMRKSVGSVSFSVLLLFSYLAPFALLAFFPAIRVEVVSFLVVRLCFEFLCLARACGIFGQSHLIKYLPLWQMIYPAYILFFSMLGVLRLYSWKK